MMCDFCGEDFNQKAEQGVTYNGIDEHHNPPQFMFEENEIWKGKLYNLCRKHHKDLHNKIIKILNIEGKCLKFIKSEYWVWIKMSLVQRKQARERVYLFTKKWMENKENDKDTRTTTRV